MTNAELVEQIKSYGNWWLEPGRIMVSPCVPVALDKHLARNYYDCRAIFAEWACPETESPLLKVAESFLTQPEPKIKKTSRKEPTQQSLF